jgi:hypothetical protein
MPRRLLLLFTLLVAAPAALAGSTVAGSMSIIGTTTTILDFGAHLVGTPTTQTIGLLAPNTNSVPVQATAITLASPDFAQTNTCVGVNVSPSGSCPMSGTFTPTATGPASATLSVTCITLVPLVGTFTFPCDGAAHQFTLTGTGLPAAIAAAVPAANPTVVGALALMLLAWGALFLRGRRVRQRR